MEDEEVLTLAAVVVGLALCACIAAPLLGCLLVNEWRQSWEQRWRGRLHRLIGKAPVEPVKRNPEGRPTRPALPPPAVDWHDTPATAARDIATATAKWFAERGEAKRRGVAKSGYEIWLDGVTEGEGGSDGTRSRPRNPAALDSRAGWLNVTLHDDAAAGGGGGGGGERGGGRGDVAVAAGRTPSASLAPLPSPLPRVAPHTAARWRASPAEAPLSSRHRPAYAAAAAAASEACAGLGAAGGVERAEWQPYGRAPATPSPDERPPLSADDGGYCHPPAPPPSAPSGAPSAPLPRTARRALAQDLLPSLLGGEGGAETRHGAHPPLPAEAGALLCSNGGSCAALLPPRSALAAAARDTWSC